MSRLTTAANTAMPYGDADIISHTVGSNASAGLQRYRFVIADAGDSTNAKPIKYPAADAAAEDVIGLVGGFRTQAPAIGGYGTTSSLGTSTDPYAAGETVAVTIRGSDLVEAAVAAGEENALSFGKFIKTDATGKAVLWAAPTALGADPTGAEITAFVNGQRNRIARALGAPDADNLVRFEFI